LDELCAFELVVDESVTTGAAVIGIGALLYGLRHGLANDQQDNNLFTACTRHCLSIAQFGPSKQTDEPESPA
jgi:hypothetical protein